jgi:hypothetical protein
VGAEVAKGDGELFEEKMRQLVTMLRDQMAESRRLDSEIEMKLVELGYEH